MASILIIQDEPRIGSFLSQGLQQVGHQTLSVTNGERAVPLALSKMFDLVLLDLSLPDLSLSELGLPDLSLPDLRGVSILRAIRAQRIQVPIIVITALYSEKERAHALLLGANEYLPKPFSFEHLLRYIYTYV